MTKKKKNSQQLCLLSGLQLAASFLLRTQRERVIIYFITFYERSFYSTRKLNVESPGSRAIFFALIYCSNVAPRLTLQSFLLISVRIYDHCPNATVQMQTSEVNRSTPSCFREPVQLRFNFSPSNIRKSLCFYVAGLKLLNKKTTPAWGTIIIYSELFQR